MTKPVFNPSEIYKNPFKYLFFLVIGFYLLMYFPYGFEDGDMGSILGISWSMYKGAFPHTDFVYIKPAFSPYFHSWFFYISEEYAYLLNRAFYYIQVFTYSWLAARLLCKMFKMPSKNTLYFIATIGALISIHNYPPMPWNTIDGLFFTSIGMTFLFREKTKFWHLLLGALFVSLAVLCKQSFFFVPVFIMLYLLVDRKFKPAGGFVGFGLLFASLFLLILHQNDALIPFYEQITSFTSGGSLLDTGVKSYYLAFKFNAILAVLAGVVILLLKRYLPGDPVFVVLNLLIATVFVSLYLQERSFYEVKRSIMQLLFLTSFGYSIFMAFRDRRFLFLLLMLSFAWCASISNGFNTPIDYSTPIVFALFVACYEITHFKLGKIPSLFILVIYLGTFFIGYQNVYMDSKRGELTYAMGDIFPQLKGVRSDEETYSKYSEFKELASEYDNFTVLPSVTLGHYLTNTVNPIGVDWVFNHHLSDQLPQYIEKLEDQDVTVFLEDFESSINNYEETSLLTVYVRDNWELIDSGEHFRIYRKPQSQ